AELGQDLLQQETPGLNARRKFLGGLLQAKPTFPQGTHTFWPYSLPLANGSFETSKELFWSGVRALGGRVMIALGPKASQYLLSSAVVESARHVEGVLCFSFADIPVLAQDPQVYQRLLQVLRYALNRSFPNLFA
ncbi:MAG: hypothetical protein IJU40_01730, partial [Desulfovibrionaceae bacterium]|nr:hypothetical protein [Desulfovibrionaceae bacterium]